MEIIGALILFIVFMFIYTLIVEVFVMLFRITGLSDEKARFQVVSMLTNSGYTTREAELITNDKQRRKLARFVMMFGYAFTVTIVSTVVNIFLQFRKTVTVGAIASIPIIIIILFLTWFFKKNRLFNKWVDKIITKVAGKIINDKTANPVIIIDDYGNVVMAKIKLTMVPKELDGIELSKSNIKREHGINVVLKNNKDGESLAQSDTIFEIGDTVVVIGNENEIRKVFELKTDEDFMTKRQKRRLKRLRKKEERKKTKGNFEDVLEKEK